MTFVQNYQLSVLHNIHKNNCGGETAPQLFIINKINELYRKNNRSEKPMW